MRTLIIEPDPEARHLLAEAAIGRGHNVTTSISTADARTELQGDPFNIVVIGWSSDAVNGRAVVTAIRDLKGGEYPYVLAVMPRPQSDRFHEAIESGADDYLAVPIPPETLSLRLQVAERHAASRVHRRESASTIIERLSVEAAVAKISATLATRQRGGVAASLAILGETLKVCRASAFRFFDNRLVVDNTHEWCRPGVPSLQHERRMRESRAMPWWVSRVESGRRIVFNSTDDVPADNPKLRAKLDRFNITACADVPLYSSEGVLFGYLGVEMSTGPRVWRDEDLQALEVAARMIGAYWERREVLEALSLRDRAMQGAYDGIIILDASTDHRPIIYANDGFCRMSGYSRDEVIGRNPGMLEGPATDPDAAAQITLAINEARPFSIELMNHRKDGSVMWNRTSITPIFSDLGKLTHYVGVFSDLTEQRHVESTLLESEQRFRAFAETSPDALVMVDAAGMVVGWNAAATGIFGIPELDAIGGHYARLVPTSSRRIAVRLLRAMIREAGQGTTVQRRFDATGARHDGTVFPIEVSLAAWATARGPFAAAIVRDVTQRRILESQLRQSQKMEALGTLAGGIAHDFNNILGPIFAHTELAIAELDAHPKSRDRLGKVLRSARRAKSLVERILAFSRKGPEGSHPIDLAACVGDSLGILSETIPKNVRLEAELGAAGIAVTADPAQVHQVVMNLVTNACQAIGSRRGKVRVTLAERQVTAPDAPTLRVAPGDYVTLQIEDDGPGIPSGVMARIFEPFFTTKSDGSGTGLGLSAVHSAMTQVGGAITVDSEPGNGAIFRCWWKRTESPIHITQTSDRRRAIGASRGRLLVVDDERELADAIAEVVRNLGFRPTVCNTAPDALAVLTQAPSEFSAVITDRMMPGMDGLELARAIRAIRQDLPIILATGYEAEGTQEACRQAGITALVHKPVSIDLIRRILDTSLEPATS